ncbi:MAG TPA: DM13 domain-containing protein [Mycobacterium sp.]|nr:DM13 domain-containing protein [Mycobacterium sp.]
MVELDGWKEYHMQFRNWAAAGFIALTGVLAACGHSSSPSSQSTPAMSSTSSAISESNARTGSFSGLNGKHVSGTVKVVGGQIVLSDFSSDPGPDLHIYLAAGSDENAVTAGSALGTVAFDKASQAFPVNGVDASKYNTVVIHCDKAKAVFGAAPLA